MISGYQGREFELTTQTNRAGAYELMDVARTLAAGMVVFSHIRDLLLANYTVATGHGMVVKSFYFMSGFGHAGVIVFFVLSGFWITKSVTGRDGQSDFWADYSVARLSRLWIVLLPALILGGVCDAIGIYGLDAPLYRGVTGASSIGPGVVQALSIAGFAGNVAFLQTLLVPPFGSNGPLWSLAYEFWFYVWFPALWLSCRRRRFSPILLLLLIGTLNPELYLGFVCWLCGAALFVVVNRIDRRDRMASGLRWLILGSGVMALLLALLVARSRPSLWFDPVLSAAFAWFLLGVCVARPRPLRLLLPLARYGARSSFSLYAIHFPIVALFAALLTGGERLPPEPRYLVLVIAVLVAVALIARLFSLLTEANTNRVRIRLRSLVGPRLAHTPQS